MNNIQFKYEEMYNFYRKHGELVQNDKVFATLYKFKNSEKLPPLDGKKRFSGRKVQFVSQNMEVRRICTEKKLRNVDDYYSLYTTTLDDINKQLFIVTPVKHFNESKTVVTADHFSFPLNMDPYLKSLRKLQLHLTEYMPIDQKTDDTEKGHTHYQHAHMLPEFQLRELRSELESGKLADYADFLHEIMSRPWKGDTQEAGGKRKERLPEHVEHPETFEELFTLLPIESILVIGIYNPDTEAYDVTVSIRDIYESPVTRGMLFHTVSGSDLLDAIADKLKQYDWNTFPFNTDEDDDEYDYDRESDTESDDVSGPRKYARRSSPFRTRSPGQSLSMPAEGGGGNDVPFVAFVSAVVIVANLLATQCSL